VDDPDPRRIAHCPSVEKLGGAFVRGVGVTA
jgi:hypothetical protein